MADYTGIPAKLADMVSVLSTMDRAERIQILIDLGDKFKPVPPEVATQPYPETAKAPHCESEAFVFPKAQEDGTLKFYFDVLNPQGISAKATAVILDRTISGAPLEEVARIPGDIMYDIFGRELSMGKNMGLTGMVNLCKLAAQKRLTATASDATH